MNYINPLYKRKPNNDPAPAGQPDPYMMFADGAYHLYCTHRDGVAYFKSGNMLDWDYGGMVYRESGRKEYWAPCVIKNEDKYYMYVSNMPENADDTHLQAIRVAVSDRPYGPFTFVREMLPPFSIDAEVVQYKGGLYMFYCQNEYDAVRAGTYIVLDKLVDPCNVEGNPKTVILPTLDEEIFKRDRFRKGQNWHTIEGASYFYHANRHYLLYSGACYMLPTYHIAYAVAEGEVNDLRDLVFRKVLKDGKYNPLLHSADDVEGMGHNSCIKCENTWYCVYHGRENDGKHYEHDVRTFRIDPITFNEDGTIRIVRKKF